jgi:hypothetical protein
MVALIHARQVKSMPFWKPDQTFYPSPRMAMQAPRERLAYVATFNPSAESGRKDSICVLEVDPQSSNYSQIVGRVEMAWATSCIISAGTHAARRSARMHRIHTSSGAT